MPVTVRNYLDSVSHREIKHAVIQTGAVEGTFFEYVGITLKYKQRNVFTDKCVFYNPSQREPLMCQVDELCLNSTVDEPCAVIVLKDVILLFKVQKFYSRQVRRKETDEFCTFEEVCKVWVTPTNIYGLSKIINKK